MDAACTSPVIDCTCVSSGHIDPRTTYDPYQGTSTTSLKTFHSTKCNRLIKPDKTSYDIDSSSETRTEHSQTDSKLHINGSETTTDLDRSIVSGSSHSKHLGKNTEQLRRRLVLDTPFSGKSIISYGLIVYAKDTQRWAIVQRKHSVEFLLIMRGIYRITHLPFLISCITAEEANLIKRCIHGGPSAFTEIFIDELDLFEGGLRYALIRMSESRNTISNLLSKIDLSQNKLKWTRPKGRLQVSSGRETPFACAKREFSEEVELNLPPPSFISDTYVSEIVRTITGRTIESRYWIYVIQHEVPMTPPNDHPEVSSRQWVSTDTCLTLIEHDSLFSQVSQLLASCD